MSIQRKTLLCFAALTLLGLLGGCGSKGTGSYVVLLRDPDGKLGQVAVKSQQGEQVLTQVFKGAALDGSKEPFFVMQDQLKRDFGAAMAALPPVAEIDPPLLFPTGIYTLDETRLQQVRNTAQKYLRLTRAGRSVDISVVGHSDGQGTESAKEKAGRDRAQNVKQALMDNGIPASAIVVEAHSDRQLANNKNPLAAENRRVEITIR